MRRILEDGNIGAGCFSGFWSLILWHFVNFDLFDLTFVYVPLVFCQKFSFFRVFLVKFTDVKKWSIFAEVSFKGTASARRRAQ